VVFQNRLFLPGKLPNKWLTIRNGLIKVTDELDTDDKEDDANKLIERLIKIGNEAIDEIYKEMKLEKIVLEEI
jgi:hypothetical protein